MAGIIAPAAVLRRMAQMKKEQVEGIGMMLWFLEHYGYKPFLYSYNFMDGEFVGIGIDHKDEVTDKIIETIRDGLKFATRGDVNIMWSEHVHVQELGESKDQEFVQKIRKADRAIDDLRKAMTERGIGDEKE